MPLFNSLTLPAYAIKRRFRRCRGPHGYSVALTAMGSQQVREFSPKLFRPQSQGP